MLGLILNFFLDHQNIVVFAITIVRTIIAAIWEGRKLKENSSNQCWEWKINQRATIIVEPDRSLTKWGKIDFSNINSEVHLQNVVRPRKFNFYLCSFSNSHRIKKLISVLNCTVNLLRKPRKLVNWNVSTVSYRKCVDIFSWIFVTLTDYRFFILGKWNMLRYNSKWQ